MQSTLQPGPLGGKISSSVTTHPATAPGIYEFTYLFVLDPQTLPALRSHPSHETNRQRPVHHPHFLLPCPRNSSPHRHTAFSIQSPISMHCSQKSGCANTAYQYTASLAMYMTIYDHTTYLASSFLHHAALLYTPPAHST